MHTSIFAIGNALVDHEYEVTEAVLADTGLSKGSMTLAETADQQILKDTLAKHLLAPVKQAGGGSAANTAYAVAALGGLSSYACRVNDDDAGRFYLQDLQSAGVTTFNRSIATADEPTGSCMVLVTPDAERTMQTHLGTSAALSFAAVDTSALENAAFIYIEGYLAASDSARDAVAKLRTEATTLGVKTALSFADPSMVNFCKSGLLDMLGAGVDVLFCNEEEATTFADVDIASVEQAAKALHQHASLVIITRGAKGVLVSQLAEDNSITSFTTAAPSVANVIDTNGAGDNFAGAFMYGLTQNMPLETCAKLAVQVSAKLITHFGPRLAKADYLAIKDSMDLA